MGLGKEVPVETADKEIFTLEKVAGVFDVDELPEMDVESGWVKSAELGKERDLDGKKKKGIKSLTLWEIMDILIQKFGSVNPQRATA